MHELDNWFDLIVYYGELFDKLGLSAPALVGHSFGALVAAEFAATAPKPVARLVLIDPVGLWRDDLPVGNCMILSDKARRPSLFADPEGEAARRFFDVPSDPAERRHACAIHLGAGLFRQVRLADRRSRLQQARASHCGAYADRLGARRTALLRRPMPKSSPGGFPARGSS